MSVQTINQKQLKSNSQPLEQLQLWMAEQYRAERSRRIKAGLARRKVAGHDSKRNTNNSH